MTAPSPMLPPDPALRATRWQAFLQDWQRQADTAQPLLRSGRLVRVAGPLLEVLGLNEAIGTLCEIHRPGQASVRAELVGFQGERAFLMPFGPTQGLSSGAPVQPCAARAQPLQWGASRPNWRRQSDRGLQLPMGDGLLGRVVCAQGLPLDGAGPLHNVALEPMARRPINAMDRDPIRSPLDCGVRAINALLTLGRGQRVGLFAGTGVGKSVLLGMMARHTAADVVVVGLIGERGREVKEFIDSILGAQGRKRSVVVAAPADAPALLRLQGAHYASAVAEHFRARGQHVLLLMDSLTRYAMAQREIALALGEPPASKGYPPSCFSKLPQLVERAGNGLRGCGSITAIYTVLSEGDDLQDPVADAARGILDGHIVLSRELAQAGHFPAIDVASSVSRVLPAILAPTRLGQVRKLRHWLSHLNQAKDILQLGAYVPGHDLALDEALQHQAALQRLLQQGQHEEASLTDSWQALADLANAPELPNPPSTSNGPGAATTAAAALRR